MNISSVPWHNGRHRGGVRWGTKVGSHWLWQARVRGAEPHSRGMECADTRHASPKIPLAVECVSKGMSAATSVMCWSCTISVRATRVGSDRRRKRRRSQFRLDWRRREKVLVRFLWVFNQGVRIDFDELPRKAGLSIGGAPRFGLLHIGGLAWRQSLVGNPRGQRRIWKQSHSLASSSLGSNEGKSPHSDDFGSSLLCPDPPAEPSILDLAVGLLHRRALRNLQIPCGCFRT